MQRFNAVAIAALSLVLAAAGGLARSSALAQPVRAKGEEPGAVAPTGATEEVVRAARGYRSWQKFPRYAQEAALSKGHGNAYVVAWYNEVAAPSVKGGGRSYPDGSIIVKENRPKPEGEPSALTVMAKRGGAWHWIKATPDWKVLTAGGKPIAGPDVAACNGCHTAAPRDMVFSE